MKPLAFGRPEPVETRSLRTWCVTYFVSYPTGPIVWYKLDIRARTASAATTAFHQEMNSANRKSSFGCSVSFWSVVTNPAADVSHSR